MRTAFAYTMAFVAVLLSVAWSLDYYIEHARPITHHVYTYGGKP